VLGVIPARGGSKGVPRKNARELAGKPLVVHTIEAATTSTTLTRVILSTDDEEIATIGRRHGADVPFLRPDDLARDDSPTLPVVLHAMEFVAAAGEQYDAVCLLQPTNPLRRGTLIDECVHSLEASDADAVITVLPVPPEHNPHWVYLVDDRGGLRLSTGEPEPIPRRQSLPPAFCREGSVYVTRWEVLADQRSLYGNRVVGVEVDPALSVNIDTEEDWSRAEALMAERPR
jgi:CMP-N-acetylneuraminic acid synthetase